MKKDEWSRLVLGIYNHKLKPKLNNAQKYFHPLERYGRIPFTGHWVFQSVRAFRFIEDSLDENDDLTKVFQQEYLVDKLDVISRYINDNNMLVVETGIADVIEEFFDEIVEGIEIEDIPEIDFEALREAGSNDPEGEILVSIIRTKKIKTKFGYNSNESEIRHSLYEREKIIHRKKERLLQCTKDNPPKKKIFTGIGSICRGTILTGVDIGLLAGAWPVPLSPEATTVGAVASIATGIGDIMVGVGALRGE